MENDLIFIEGMSFEPVPQNAPEAVRGKIYFNWNRFKAFAEQHVNERGWINVKMMKSARTGNIYFIKDTFVPKVNSELITEYNENKYKVEPKENMTDQERINDEVSDKLFGSHLSEEEHDRLNDIPFN